MLVQHLAEQGYRRIAFVGIANDSTAVYDRGAGYHEGLRLCGLPVEDALVVTSGGDSDTALCDRLLAASPDAIICKDTERAAALSTMLARRGHRVGADIGMAGFDDDPIATMLPTPLTVVRQPIAPFASAVYHAALSTAGTAARPPSLPRGIQIVIPTELVVRASTRPRGQVSLDQGNRPAKRSTTQGSRVKTRLP